MTTRELIEQNPNIAIGLWMDKNTDDGIKSELESYFQDQIRNDPRFSREDVYHHFRVNSSFSISFWPTSKSFKKYGDSVTVLSFLGTDDEIKEIAINMMNKIPTQGDMKLKAAIGNQEEIVVVNSSDIFEIWSQNH